MPKGYFTRTRKPLIERLMAFVSPEPNTGCWLWMGGVTGGKIGCGYIGRGGRHGGGVRALCGKWSTDLFLKGWS